MIREERLLKVVRAPHVSEKASAAMEKSNTIVLKVARRDQSRNRSCRRKAVRS